MRKKFNFFFAFPFVNLIYSLDLFIKQQQNTKTMTHLLEFEKITPKSSYETIYYKSVYKINDKIFRIYIDKCISNPNKYTFDILHNGRTYRAFATYTSAKKAMIDSQIRLNNLVSNNY